MLYNDYLQKVAKRFDDLLGDISAHHNFELGTEYEVALCRFLREILPQKFGVCRGYVVAADGSQAGDDIIIYDQDRFPTLRLLPAGEYARKQDIPVEALCAYIEAKHSLVLEGEGDQSLHKAFCQVRAVKMLTREPVPRRAPDPYMRPYEEFEKKMKEVFEKSGPKTYTSFSDLDLMAGWPKTRNPIFGAVISRQARPRTGGVVLTEPGEVRIALENASLPPKPWPDLVIADKNTFMMPVVETAQGIGYVSPFMATPASVLDIWQRESLAFAIGICSLLFALDYIRLGVMPWMKILADGVGIEPGEQSPDTETPRSKKE